MRFIAAADTDVGNVKETNQDSYLVKHAMTKEKEVMMAVICDGMGGLEKGELASATVIRAFDKWFREELPYELGKLDMQVIGEKWSLLLKDLNVELLAYSRENRISLGTTFSGVLFIGDRFVMVHVGDTRIYHIREDAIRQLTTDQTFVEREISRGNMTREEARTDKRRNMLLQCVGASRIVEPKIIHGKTQEGLYLLCSDGLRHEVSEEEMTKFLNRDHKADKDVMKKQIRHLIDLAKSRKEKDNISAVLIRVD